MSGFVVVFRVVVDVVVTVVVDVVVTVVVRVVVVITDAAVVVVVVEEENGEMVNNNINPSGNTMTIWPESPSFRTNDLNKKT